MVAEIGELGVAECLSLVASAGRGQSNAFLQRAIALGGSRQNAVDSAGRFARLIHSFAVRFGKDRRIYLCEAPGRVNLMGMHIDHRGGVCNPVATRERVRAVCSRRDDDLISARSLTGDFGESQFRLCERLPEKPPQSLGQWLNWTEKEATAVHGGKDFINYFACGPVYLACFHYPWGRRFAGADFLFESDLPPSAGLSSSSALVILATDFFLRCNPEGVEDLSLHQLLDVYGNGEWYIGTRGGKGDHAAIKLCRAAAVQPMTTTPDLQLFDPAPIPEGYDIILYQSGDAANKSVEPFKTAFNAPIIAYQAVEMMLADYLRNQHRPALEELRAARSSMDAKHRQVYLGDVVNYAILTEPEIYQFLRLLPRAISRRDLFSRFADHAPNLRDGMQDAGELEGGYRIRGVGAFGLSECARAKEAGPLLAAGNVPEFAQMMNVSQLGDHVTEVNNPSNDRVKFLTDETLSSMETECFPVRKIAGDYRVSTPNMDRLASICLACPGVLGARLSGAGLGGALIVLGKEGFSEVLDPMLQRCYYEPLGKEFQKIPIVPSQGAGFY